MPVLTMAFLHLSVGKQKMIEPKDKKIEIKTQAIS